MSYPSKVQMQWPALAWDAALLTIPNSPIESLDELCKAYGITPEEFRAILGVPHFQYMFDASLQELQKQGSKAGLKYRAMCFAQSLFESLYRKANKGEMKDSDALKLLESLIKAAGIDKEPAGTTQVNVQANIGLPFPTGVKKVAQFVEAVEEG